MRHPIWYAVLAAGLLAACSKSGSGLSVSASSRGSASTAATTSASIDAGNGLSIDRLRVLVRRVELEGEPACAAATGDDGASGPSGPTGPTGPSGSDGMSGRAAPAARASGAPSRAGTGEDDGDGDEDGEGACEIERGPILIDLAGGALGAPAHLVATVDVPFGTYQEVKFKIGTISAADAGTDAGLLAMQAAHASIIVDGTRTVTAPGGGTTTTPFTFSTPISVEQEREGGLVVGDGANVTFDVDPSGWFKAVDGTLLDPSDATAQGAILANVRASLRVLEDHDHDGHDDHDGEGPGHP